MKILMMLNAPYPADIRVKKEAKALTARGLEVHLLCLRRKNEAYQEQVDGMFAHRINAGKNNYALAFWDIVLALFFFHPIFFIAARRINKQHKIKVIHVHDLPLSGTAFALKKYQSHLKVVVDFHENYPEALRTWFQWKRNPLARLKNYLFMNPDRWLRHEQTSCMRADHIIAVVDEMKQRLQEQHRVPEHKITVVTNSEDRAFLGQPIQEDVYRHLSGKFILTYSGGIGPHRGVDTAILGMTKLVQYPIHLVIVGSGSKDAVNMLKTLVTRNRLNNVEFWGHQPFNRFYSIMHFADVNVIPHLSNDHTDNTVPHKLFQAMLAARPVLVSSARPLKRIIESCRCGLVFEAGAHDQFAERVIELYKNRALCNELGENGWKGAGEGVLNWEHDQKQLIQVYKDL